MNGAFAGHAKAQAQRVVRAARNALIWERGQSVGREQRKKVLFF